MFLFQYPLPLAVWSDTPAIATTTQSQRATHRTEPPMDSYDSKPRMISKTEDKKDTGQMTNKSNPEISMKKSEATRKTNQERKLARSKNSDDMDMASSAHKLIRTTWIFIFTCIMLLWMRYNREKTKNKNSSMAFVQRRSNLFDVGPSSYKWYTNVLCLLG